MVVRSLCSEGCEWLLGACSEGCEWLLGAYVVRDASGCWLIICSSHCRA